MNIKFIILIAILALAGAAYWAFQEGVFDDLLPGKSAQDNLAPFDPTAAANRGPDGPVSRVPGLSKGTDQPAAQPTGDDKPNSGESKPPHTPKPAP